MLHQALFAAIVGITPAGAGKTQTAYDEMQYHKDHPRRCGENTQAEAEQRLTWGSPPQVRGKREFFYRFYYLFRITPAGAGKTIVFNRTENSLWDHPRRCGENITSDRKTQCRAGSPPQVRGKLAIRSLNRLSPRITPAGAGKTFKSDFFLFIP